MKETLIILMLIIILIINIFIISYCVLSIQISKEEEKLFENHLKEIKESKNEKSNNIPS